MEEGIGLGSAGVSNVDSTIAVLIDAYGQGSVLNY